MTVASAQATFAATLVDEWVRAGVRHAVVAPGSRSTPLALALAGRPEIEVHVFLDERSAAFFAVGAGLAGGLPAVLLTTSGTAAAEIHAGVVEAHHAGVPMIVCTADRPPELHHVGAPQTIEQEQLFAGVVRFAASPGPADEAASATWRSLASRALCEAVGGRGPVHLNLAFREPLVDSVGELPPGREGDRPWHTLDRPLPTDVGDLSHLSGRGLVVAGAGCGGRTVLEPFVERLGWPVLADPRSGVRAGDRGVVTAFDAIVRSPDVPRPDIVVRLGAPPASRVLSEWVSGEVVLVDPHGTWSDPARQASHVIAADPVAAAWALADQLSPAEPDWLDWWTRAEARAHDAIEDVLAGTADATEPGVARELTAALPPDAVLFVSSSMPIRDVEWFGSRAQLPTVLSNRGANGIDGVVASALGVATAVGRDRQVVALLGDLAFLHDSGALLWAGRREVSCTFVVVDNDGGGIFEFLPQASALERTRFEQLFGTPHGIDLGALAAVHGLPVHRVDKGADLLPAVEASYRAGGVHLVHVRTDREANVALHRRLNEAVAAAVGR